MQSFDTLCAEAIRRASRNLLLALEAAEIDEEPAMAGYVHARTVRKQSLKDGQVQVGVLSGMPLDEGCLANVVGAVSLWPPPAVSRSGKRGRLDGPVSGPKRLNPWAHAAETVRRTELRPAENRTTGHPSRLMAEVIESMAFHYYVRGWAPPGRKTLRQQLAQHALARQVQLIEQLLNREDYSLRMLLAADRRVRHLQARGDELGLPYHVWVRPSCAPALAPTECHPRRWRELTERYFLYEGDSPEVQRRPWSAWFSTELARLQDETRLAAEEQREMEEDAWQYMTA